MGKTQFVALVVIEKLENVTGKEVESVLAMVGRLLRTAIIIIVHGCGNGRPWRTIGLRPEDPCVQELHAVFRPPWADSHIRVPFRYTVRDM